MTNNKSVTIPVVTLRNREGQVDPGLNGLALDKLSETISSVLVMGTTGEWPSATYHEHWDMLCLLYTSPSPRDATLSRMPSSA